MRSDGASPSSRDADQPRNPRTGSEPPAMRSDGASPSSRDADGADLTLVAGGQVSGIYTAPAFVAKDAAGQTVGEKRWASPAGLGHEGALAHLMEWIQAHHGRDHRLAAVGHRVVHGGRHFVAPTRLDAAVVAKLETLVPLAPLHQPHNLAPIRTLLARAPELPQIACFDTAMHRTFPRVEQMFALPPEWEEEGVRRYGLHGLSYEYIATGLPRIDAARRRGARRWCFTSATAPACARSSAGRSVASTMGFTGVDGLPMGTRSGALDPGVMLYLMDAARDGRARDRDADLQASPACSACRACRATCATLLASTEPRRGAGGRPVRLPHRARARLAGRRPRRARRHRLHRRHRRARRRRPRARLPAARPGSASRSTPRPTPRAARASARRRAGPPPG